MRKGTFEEYCDNLAEFYRSYVIEDKQLQKLVVRNFQDVKNRGNKEIAELQKQIEELKKSKEDWQTQAFDFQTDVAVLEKALELACKEVPSHHCPCPPERVDMTNEYGSDTPVYIYDGGCDYEDGSECLNCCVKYLKQQAEKELGDKE